ncbi:MAG: LysR family transcriptional regulator [Pseudomonadota bacterium]
MDLKPIRVFLAVVDVESFSGAADMLGLAPASVTRIIAQLEADLGAQLLVRTTRKVGLTRMGASLAARFRPIVDAFDEIVDETIRAEKPDQGHLRITAPVSFGLQIVPEVIAGFRLAYPQVSLDLHFTDTLVDVIAENCDLAIRVSDAPKDQTTIWRKLCEVPRKAVASPAFRARLGPLASPADLKPEWMLSYSASNEAELWEFSKSGITRTRRAGRHLISNNGDFLLALVRNGEGIAALPDFIVAQSLEEGALVEVLPEWTVRPLWLSLAYPPYVQLPPLVNLFAEHFEAVVLASEGGQKIG